MGTVILQVIPAAMVFGALAFSLYAGARLYRSHGFLSPCALACTFTGLAAGRLLDRAVRLPKFLDDWVSYRGGAGATVSFRAEPYLAVLSTEVALMLSFAAIIVVIGTLLIRRDAMGRTASAAPLAKFGPLAVLIVLALGLTIRSKIAVAAAFVLAKAHLI
ncbi:MAG TPA: hypothetical protein VGG37_03485 [Opitutaceae bacterium]|jgi:hypothetical protein